MYHTIKNEIETSKTYQVALGILAGYAQVPIATYIAHTTILLMKKAGLEITKKQYYFQLLDFLSFRFQGGLLLLSIGNLLKLASIVFFVAIEPVFEEKIFRYPPEEDIKEKPQNDIINALSRILISSLVFAIFHCLFLPFQGWTTVPILVVTFFLGISLAILREVTGNITAPIASHTTNNALVILLYILRYGF